MHLINEMEMAKILRARWIQQYGSTGTTERRLARKLKALSENPTPDEVDQTFASHAPEKGHSNRVDRGPYECDECHEKYDQVVRMGRDSDWTSGPSNICQHCLYKAIRLIDGE